MEKFENVKSIVAPLWMDNIDTDMIIPKQFLKTIKKSGLGKNLFYEMRYGSNGEYIEDFILHKKPYNEAKILIAGENFGCGSSREHAPWALKDFGFRVIIAVSFADIFFNNCFKNGILSLCLEKKIMEELKPWIDRKEMFEVNLVDQTLCVNSRVFPFHIDDFYKNCLLHGLDDIGLTLQKEQKITEFEKHYQKKFPWLA